MSDYGDIFGRYVDATAIMREFLADDGGDLAAWLRDQSRALWGADHREEDWGAVARSVEADALHGDWTLDDVAAGHARCDVPSAGNGNMGTGGTFGPAMPQPRRRVPGVRAIGGNTKPLVEFFPQGVTPTRAHESLSLSTWTVTGSGTPTRAHESPSCSFSPMARNSRRREG